MSSAASARSINGGGNSSNGAVPLQDTTAERMAEVENQAGGVASEIRKLKDAQDGRLDRDKDLLAKQEEASVASGHSYSRTPTGGMSGLGDSLKTINIGKMGEGSLAPLVVGRLCSLERGVWEHRDPTITQDGSPNPGRPTRQARQH